MAPSAEPAADLSSLPNADGSATFSYSGYTVTAAVNGPIEAQRRDENPFEAFIDVNVRPAAGVGGTTSYKLFICSVPMSNLNSYRHGREATGVDPAARVAPTHPHQKLSAIHDSDYAAGNRDA